MLTGKRIAVKGLAAGIYNPQPAFNPQYLRTIQPAVNEAGDLYGTALASDGVSLFVGAPLHDNTTANSGAVYRVNDTGMVLDTFTAGSYQESSAIFGQVIATNGEWLMVSGDLDDGPATDAGAVYAFHRTTAWDTEPVEIKSPSPVSAGRFGSSISIGDNWMVIGERGYSGNTGRAHVYQLIAGAWTHRQTLVGDGGTNTMFGWSTALYGDYMAISAYAEGSGAVYVYRQSGGTWSLFQKIASPGHQRFGFSLAMKNRLLAIGSPYPTTGNGGVYVFRRSTTYAEEAVLTVGPSSGTLIDPSAPATNLQVGGSTAILGDDRIVTGCYAAAGNTGKVYVFEKPGRSWQPAITNILTRPSSQFFGFALLEHGNTLVVGERNSSVGKIHLYG